MAAALASTSALAVRPALRSSSSRRVTGARQSVRVQAKIGNWNPGSKTPDYLEDLPGSYGFDPLGLGKDPEALKWYVQAELMNGRWAMTAVAGILFPAALTKAGLLKVPVWYNAGKEGMYLPFTTLLAIEVILFGFVETKRWLDIKKPGSQGEEGSFFGFESAFKGTGEVGYPGGVFDPLGLSKNKEALEDFKVREIKNGRLAMLAFLGFCAQFVATGKDPLTNLGEHVSNPALNNFTTNGLSLPFKL